MAKLIFMEQLKIKKMERNRYIVLEKFPWISVQQCVDKVLALLSPYLLKKKFIIRELVYRLIFEINCYAMMERKKAISGDWERVYLRKYQEDIKKMIKNLFIYFPIDRFLDEGQYEKVLLLLEDVAEKWFIKELDRTWL